MTNLLEDFYRAHYVAGLLGRPIFHVLGMKNKSGKSLMTNRLHKQPHITVFTGDVTANMMRKTASQLDMANLLDKHNLIIVEDWTKIRPKLRIDVATLLAGFATGIIALSQEGLVIEPTKVHCSVIINVPTSLSNQPINQLISVGAGDRFTYFNMELSGEQKKKLDDIGTDNFDESLTDFKICNIENKIPYKIFKEEFLKDIQNNRGDLTFAYACAHIRPTLYDELMVAKNRTIKEIDWDHCWDID